MSIIHEALKKVQQSMSIPQAKSEEMVEVLTSPDKKIAQHPLSPFLVAMGLVILVAAGLYFINMQKFAHLPLHWRGLTTKQVSLAKPAVAAIPAVKMPQVPNAPPPPLDPFNLQGVMADGSHSVALINDNIYEEGALVNDARIIKIGLDSVTIERNGKQETISVKK